jgi:hypothetical protein
VYFFIIICEEKKIWQVTACAPVCPGGCEHGTCSAPGLCHCASGYSGERCQNQGCPPGKWGPGCSNPCPCLPGMRRTPKIFQNYQLGKWGPRCSNPYPCLPGTRTHKIFQGCQLGKLGPGFPNPCPSLPGVRTHKKFQEC